MNTPSVNEQQLKVMKSRPGFIAAPGSKRRQHARRAETVWHSRRCLVQRG